MVQLINTAAQRSLLTITASLLVGCSVNMSGEDPSEWFDPGTQIDVLETQGFTDVNYDFPANDEDGIGELADRLFPVSGFDTAFEPDAVWDNRMDCDFTRDNNLPFEVEGIVTVHPRFYFKTYGCDRDDEKYYGSYFIQDRTGGVFVLGDSKVAHFDSGDRVRMKVRAVRTAFDLDMVYAHDILEIDRGPYDIYYETVSGPLGFNDIGEVRRVVGTVATEPDGFGEFKVEADNGMQYSVQLDIEINRRGVSFPVGTRITATGPVLYSYSVFSIVIMRVGQLSAMD